MFDGAADVCDDNAVGVDVTRRVNIAVHFTTSMANSHVYIYVTNVLYIRLLDDVW